MNCFFQWFASQDQGKGSIQFLVVLTGVLLKNGSFFIIIINFLFYGFLLWFCRNKFLVACLFIIIESMTLCFSESCGVLVAIALADMHECQPNKSLKRVNKGYFQSGDGKRQNFKDQPRSAFRFFMYNLFCIYMGYCIS